MSAVRDIPLRPRLWAPVTCRLVDAILFGLSAGAVSRFLPPPYSLSRVQHAVHRRESSEDKPGAGAIAGAWAGREDLLEIKKVGVLCVDGRLPLLAASPGLDSDQIDFFTYLYHTIGDVWISLCCEDPACRMVATLT